MARKNQRIYTILGAAVGTGLAVYGIRQGLRWYRQRQGTSQPGMEFAENYRSYQGRYQADREAIPMTGAMPPAAPAPTREMTGAERVNSDRVGDFDDRGTAFTTSESDTPLTGEARGVTGNVHGDDAERPSNRDRDMSFGVSGSGTTVRGEDIDPNRTRSYGTVGETETRPDWDTSGSVGVNASDTGEEMTTPGSGLPANTGGGSTTVSGTTRSGMGTGTGTGSGGGMGTGSTGSMGGQQSGMGAYPAGQTSEVVMDEVVAPLIEHAIAFHSVMNLLRSRQRDGQGNEGIESLTDGDRNSMRAVLDQMQERVMEYDETTMRKNPLALRSYNMTRKLRDALDNLNYTGSDLYRIYDEVQKELCVLARELDNSGRVTITGLDHIRQLYECQGMR